MSNSKWLKTESKSGMRNLGWFTAYFKEFDDIQISISIGKNEQGEKINFHAYKKIGSGRKSYCWGGSNIKSREEGVSQENVLVYSQNPTDKRPDQNYPGQNKNLELMRPILNEETFDGVDQADLGLIKTALGLLVCYIN